jgi:thiosulfate/3-mercaptopyruvate sulfurtransferase
MLPPVVDRHWLDAHRAGVVLVDVRRSGDKGTGREAYAKGHLPGAAFMDLDHGLSAEPSPEAGRHPLPEPEHFAAVMAEAGVGDTDSVVAYDDENGVIAARLVWMLRVTGHDAALLDGGLRAGEHPLETGQPARPRAAFEARPWPSDALADADDARDSSNVVLDARSRERYLGAVHPLDPRPGHIPGAHSLPCLANIDPDGRLLAADELRRRFAAAGVGSSAPVVSYCGSGVTACHTLIVMEHVGLGRGRLYPGSWSQYAGAPDRPVATGTA